MLLLRPVYVVVPSKRPLISPVTRRWHSSTNNSNNNNNDAGGEDRDTTPETVHISFLQPDDTIKTVEARVGESFLQLAHRHDVDLEGACEGACVYVCFCVCAWVVVRVLEGFGDCIHAVPTMDAQPSMLLPPPSLCHFPLSLSCPSRPGVCACVPVGVPVVVVVIVVDDEGVCACSTCHLIFPKHVFDMLPEPSEDEEDMLDMAFGLTEFSRLGCQVSVTHNMDKIQVEMPKATRNFYVDGHVPKPH